jgi:hypothetical protein
MQPIFIFLLSSFYLPREFFYPLYSHLATRNVMHNLNNNRKMNNSIIVTAVTTKAANGGRRRVLGGGPKKK